MRATWSAIAAVVFNAGVAWADPPADERAMAEAEAAYEAQRYEDAIRLYRSLHETTQDVRATARLAQAEQAAGRWQEARQHYAEALRSHNNPWIEARRERIVEQQRSVEAHLGRLRVHVSPSGATVRVDDVLLQETEVDAYLQPGLHTVTVTSYGHNDERRYVTLQPQAIEDLYVQLHRHQAPAVRLSPLGRMPSERDLAEARVQHAFRTRPEFSYETTAWMMVIGGGVLAAGGVGIGLIVHGNDAFEANPQCGRSGMSVVGGETCRSLDRLHTYGLVLTVLGALGGLPTFIGGLLEWNRVHGRREAFRTSSGLSMRLGPGPGTLGLGLTATF